MYAGNILKNSNVYCLSKCVVGSLARNQIICVRFVFCFSMCNFLFAVRVLGCCVFFILVCVKVVSLVVLHILMCVKVVILVVFQVGIGLFTFLCVFICVCIC